MRVYQVFRYELKPNKKQEELLKKHAGTARFAYNWGLSLVKEKKAKPNAMEIHKMLNLLKKTEFSWMCEVSKCAPQEALRDLERAFKNLFEERANYPKFKKKGKDDSFRLTGSIKIVDANHIQLPRIGIIRTKEKTDKYKGRVLSATVKREADRWYVSIRVEVERDVPKLPQKGVVGVDCNVEKIVTTEGEYSLPRPLNKYMHTLKRRSKQHARKKRGSNNKKKSALALARLHRKIKNIRLDFYHKLSTKLAKTKQAIAVESLKVKNMMKNPYLSKSIFDSGWGMFLRMLEYKSKWYGSQLIKAPVWFASTKRCSKCGIENEMPLWKRLFTCSRCGLIIDRDLNSAINLANYALPQVLRELTPVEIGSAAERRNPVYEQPVAEAGSDLWINVHKS